MKTLLFVLHIAALLIAILAAGAAVVLLLILCQLSGFATASSSFLPVMFVITGIGVVTTLFAAVVSVKLRLFSAILSWMGSLFLAPLLCQGLLGRWDWELGVFVILGLASVILGLMNVLAQASALQSLVMKSTAKVQ